MPSAAVAALESLLTAKRVAHTLIKPWRIDAPARVLATGVPALDAMLAGGWRQGEVSELVGPSTSGRTSTWTATLAATTASGGLAAVVDAMDTFDPRLAAEAGCDLDRVLWVRGPAVTVSATRAMLDRALRQAIRAFDLVVRAGGFSVVVLDVADMPPQVLRGVPIRSWMRVARSVEGQRTVCLLASRVPLGRSARGVTVELSGAARWSGTSAQSRRLAGLGAEASVRASHALFGTAALELRA